MRTFSLTVHRFRAAQVNERSRTRYQAPFRGIKRQRLGASLRTSRVGDSHRSRRLAVCPLAAHQELYHATDEPITTFGYATNFDEVYELGERIGSGTFGTVYVGVERATGRRFAIKRMPKNFSPDGFLDRYYVRRVRNEVDIGTHLGPSLNVAYFYGGYESPSAVDLVVELCTGGTLWDKIKERGGQYTERDAARLVRELLRTVAQCHASGVMMRDIKPENFLFATADPDAPLKAIDFGISVFLEPGQTVDLRAGTPIYIAPEVLKCKYTRNADLWSVGIVAYQLLTGRLPFSGEEGDEVAEEYMSKQVYNNKDVFRAVLYADLDFESPPWDVLSSGAKELVQSLLQRDPEARPTAEQALAHPWLQEEGADGATLGNTIVQRLQRYGTFGRLKQAALRKVAQAAVASSGAALPEALRTSFAQLDKANTGRIPVTEILAELQGGHFQLTPEEAEQLMAQVDADSDGEVDWEEWVAVMSDWRTLKDTHEWDAFVEEAFKTLDRNADDALDASDLEVLLCGEEGCAAPAEVDSALREVDADHDGSVSLDEFKELLAEHNSDLMLFDSRVVEEGGKGGRR